MLCSSRTRKEARQSCLLAAPRSGKLTSSALSSLLDIILITACLKIRDSSGRVAAREERRGCSGHSGHAGWRSQGHAQRAGQRWQPGQCFTFKLCIRSHSIEFVCWFALAHPLYFFVNLQLQTSEEYYPTVAIAALMR